MIRRVLEVLAGVVVGLLIVGMALIYNPLVERPGLSPLAVSDEKVVQLSYSVAASDAVIYTNNGQSQIRPVPPRVQQLWEPTVRNSTAAVHVLEDSRGRVSGIGVKLWSKSERSSIYDGQALVDSVWQIYLPGRGTVFVQQTENYWSYLQDIVLPAYRSAGDNWRGTWVGTITAGPGALGTGFATGGSGEFAALERSSAVEVLTAKAYTMADGPVSMTGEIAIEIPAFAVESAATAP